MSVNKELIVQELGKLLENAVRTSVAHGAQYEYGERIVFTVEASWQKVALNLIQLVEVIIEEKQAVATKE